METENKRARRTPDQQEILGKWQRLLQKIFLLLNNFLMENVLNHDDRDPMEAIKANADKMDVLDLKNARDFIEELIHRKENSPSEEDDHFSLVSGAASSTSRTPPTRQMETDIDKVAGIEILFGTRPTCHCGEICKLRISLEENDHYEWTYFQCPKVGKKGPGVQCRYKTWTKCQPFTNVTTSKYKSQPGRPALMPPEALKLMVQEKCVHMQVTKAGSNQFVRRETCRICQKILLNESKKPTSTPSPKASPSSSEDAAEFIEFLKYQEWRKDQKKK